jgi:hypothetical protein
VKTRFQNLPFKCNLRRYSLVYASLSAWVDAVASAKTDRRRLEKCLMRLSQRVMYSSFTAWVVAVEELKQQRVITRRVLAKISQRQVASAFLDWLGMVREKKAWTKKLAVSERFITAMHQRTIFGAFSRWHEMAREAREMRVKVRRSVQRMLQRVVSSAFFDWQAKVEAKRDEEQQAALGQKVWETKIARCERFVAAMQRRTLHAAFSRWEEVWHEQVRLRRKLQGCLARFSKRSLVVGLYKLKSVYP